MVRVERPASTAELAECLAEADRTGLAVLPRGGGRAMGMGGEPERADLILETGGLNRLLELSAADLTLTVEAGIPLAELQRELEKEGQFLPLDPYNEPGHSIGGVLASGWTGPLRLAYGGPRDYLLGLKVALPDGRVTRSGGKVVKNVSGYDLKKLHLGALGSLGVIVEASFKVFPRPAAEVTLRWTGPELDGALAEARRALAAAQPPIALVLESTPSGYLLSARLAGWPRAIGRISAELGWEEIDPDFWRTHQMGGSDAWARISVPPARLDEVLPVLPVGGWACSVGVGSVQWFEARQRETVEDVRRRAEAAGGHLVLLQAPLELKQAVGPWGAMSSDPALTASVRQAFDPNRTMAPGRFVV